MVKNKIFWNEACVHKWNKYDTKKSKKYDTYLLEKENLKIDDYIYNYDKLTEVTYQYIENYLKSSSLKEKLEYLIELTKNNNKNRFVHSKTKVSKEFKRVKEKIYRR